jgi:hypothetical protein
MRIGSSLATLSLAAALVAGPVSAATLYSNAPDLSSSQNGDCVYNTTCGPLNLGNAYGAQKFTLADPATVLSIGINTLVGSSPATGANWIITDASGAGGLPGATLGSGAGTAFTVSAGPLGALYPTTNYLFNIAALPLSAGDYYVAVQAVTTQFGDLLSKGVATSGAATTADGGLTWFADYQGFGSVALSVYGESVSVPEPATMALLGAGLLGLGFARRKRA